ncbi:uncharacterized protein KY384_000107 [Bacidia gigantensis]|uniref:uncharacterized protein n=1 Tax=Bacidia gigantensis TaxID=2732470 RepID=UPI001D04CD99|nr:uncharacterized protein KY384_000107 [Bacidia gigantensis]KAG8526114.1 hypothetical protein KY384_000107 [Bacidia gigantensis]
MHVQVLSYAFGLLGTFHLVATHCVPPQVYQDNSNPHDDLYAIEDAVGQSVLVGSQKGQQNTLLAGNRMINESKLVDAVRSQYLAKYPSEMKASQHLVHVTGTQQNRINYGWGDARMIDIQFPLMGTCKPKVSKSKEVAEGIYCGQEAGCQVTRQVTLTDGYESTLGFGISTTISAETDIVFVKASIATTYEFSYEYKWSHSESSTNSYTFNLLKGEYCTPSMVHLNLECDVASDIVFYDTTWDDGPENMWLEENNHRMGGPYQYGQWCRTMHLKEDILKQDKYFDAVLKEDPPRGKAWLRPSSELNKYKKNSNDKDIHDDEVVIRRGERGRGGDFSQVFVCKRYLPSTQREKTDVPVHGSSNKLLGFIGCI